MVKISGDSFIIRNWKRNDLEGLVDAINYPEIAENMGDNITYPYTQSDALEHIESYEHPQSPNLAITIDDEIAGGIEIIFAENNSAKLEYWLSEKYRGKGIMTQVVKTMTKYAFKNYRLERIECRIYPWNSASAKVAQKSGFKYEGTLKNGSKKYGKPVDIMIYSITRTEEENFIENR